MGIACRRDTCAYIDGGSVYRLDPLNYPDAGTFHYLDT